jgi:hypothetical protein
MAAQLANAPLLSLTRFLSNLHFSSAPSQAKQAQAADRAAKKNKKKKCSASPFSWR